MLPDSTLFVDIADAVGLGNPAIVEKDYYVVQLLALVSSLEFTYHTAIFSGGTALAKSAINTYRMSEDVDIKLVPNQAFKALSSRNAKKKEARRAVKRDVELCLTTSDLFSIEDKPIVRDESRYFCFDIRYPQVHQRAPCLRPYIKLEFIESDLLSEPQIRSVQSIYAKYANVETEVSEMACAAIIETQAEKLLSMLRRTASVARNSERDEDNTLIRHIYNTYHIQQAQPSDIEQLSSLTLEAIKIDVKRYGNQHPQLIESPVSELRFGLNELKANSCYAERYNSYVAPMVYDQSPASWKAAFHAFEKLAEYVLERVEKSGSYI